MAARLPAHLDGIWRTLAPRAGPDLTQDPLGLLLSAVAAGLGILLLDRRGAARARARPAGHRRRGRDRGGDRADDRRHPRRAGVGRLSRPGPMGRLARGRTPRPARPGRRGARASAAIRPATLESRLRRGRPPRAARRVTLAMIPILAALLLALVAPAHRPLALGAGAAGAPDRRGHDVRIRGSRGAHGAGRGVVVRGTRLDHRRRDRRPRRAARRRTGAGVRARWRLGGPRALLRGHRRGVVARRVIGVALAATKTDEHEHGHGHEHEHDTRARARPSDGRGERAQRTSHDAHTLVQYGSAKRDSPERPDGSSSSVHVHVHGNGGWCRRRDSNPHGFPHTPLKRACLPFHHSGRTWGEELRF